ncbi:uncharacterized protein LOC123562225 [Mercenaria mercenaria]|uniref:uncharacterized protein LOC123562225 n=1 Tax=Mercenaria mercenaria TaxID=6596 RepID=UPI00234F836B|nr:uncharacterized protein LOC123562225 [Mercenaria mercenaria]
METTGITNNREAVDAFNISIREYTKHKFEQFRKQLQDEGKHFDSGFNVSWMSKQTKWHKRRGVWNCNPSTDCELCKELFEEVIALHRQTDKIGFKNCKKKRVGGCWGIAKLFMPENNQDIVSPEHTDVVTILHIMMNCRLFMTFDNDTVEKIVQGQMMVAQYSIYGNMQSYQRSEFFTAMKTLLQSLIQDEIISNNLKQAVSKINTVAAGPPNLITPCTAIRAIGRFLGFILGIVTENWLILYGLRRHVLALLYFLS